MIRFTEIKGIYQDDALAFGFYNTVTGCFLHMNGLEVFDSMSDFEDFYDPACGYTKERLYKVCPQYWVDDLPNPSTQPLSKDNLDLIGWIDAKEEFIHDGYKYSKYKESVLYKSNNSVSFELIPSHEAYGQDKYVIYMNQNDNKFVLFSGYIGSIKDLQHIMELTRITSPNN